MQNPWKALSNKSPYILSIDQQWFLDYQNKLLLKSSRIKEPAKRGTYLLTYKLWSEDVPLPYYGNPQTARVVVLQANPGHDFFSSKRLDQQKINELDCQNLFHTLDPGIYTMAEEFREYIYTDGTPGMCWYWKRTKRLREKVGWERVARGLIYLEMFPYRSKKWANPDRLPPSQEYTFYLLRQLLAKEVWVIVSRLERQWAKQVPELKEYKKLTRLNSHQNVTLSEGNMNHKAFNSICDSLKQSV